VKVGGFAILAALKICLAGRIGGGCGLLRTSLWLVLPANREISGRILQRCHLQVEVFKHKAAISAINSGFIKIIAGRKFTQAGRL
jgi:hypothetical protein